MTLALVRPSGAIRASLSFFLLTLLCTPAAAAAPRPSADEIRTALEEVLSRPEFSPAARQTWWTRVIEWLVDAFAWLGSLREVAPLLYWLLLIGCLMLLGLLVTHIVMTVRRVLFTGAAGAGTELHHEQRQRLSRVFAEEARRRAAERDFTEAIRCLFLSLVYRFDETGKVSFLKNYTNREYLDLFHQRPQVHDRLGVFVDILDDHWYGQRPADARQYESCVGLYEGLL